MPVPQLPQQPEAGPDRLDRLGYASTQDLLGLYEGINRLDRGSGYHLVTPDRITLFRSTIERVAGRDDVRLREVIAHTVAHEIAHHFGISDDRLREIDAY